MNHQVGDVVVWLKKCGYRTSKHLCVVRKINQDTYSVVTNDKPISVRVMKDNILRAATDEEKEAFVSVRVNYQTLTNKDRV